MTTTVKVLVSGGYRVPVVFKNKNGTTEEDFVDGPNGEKHFTLYDNIESIEVKAEQPLP